MDIAQCACSGKNLDRLVRPALLALLAPEGTHGYDLVQQLGRLQLYADCPPDTSGVYKVLKAMEKEGLISASWDLDGGGPAKRRYVLSSNGLRCLEQWAQTLQDYRSQLDELLALLQQENRSSAGLK